MSSETAHIVITIYRDVVEKNLTFLGLLVMENKLKPETSPIIDVLNSANVKTVMVTGKIVNKESPACIWAVTRENLS